MNPPNAEAPVISDGNSSDDTENLPEKEKETHNSTQPSQQSIPPLKWYSICVGLYLTALLYGTVLT
jgi:hypothetical protein